MTALLPALIRSRGGEEAAASPITYVGAGTLSQTTSSTTLSVTLDAGHSPGDALLVVVTVSDDQTLTAPSGWTEVWQQGGTSGNDNQTGVWYRFATGAEGASAEWTAAASVNWNAVCLAYSGVISVADTSANDFRSALTATPASFTGSLPTVGSGDWVVAALSFSSSATVTEPTGYTGVIDDTYFSQKLAVAHQQTDSAPSAETWTVSGALVSNVGPVVLKASGPPHWYGQFAMLHEFHAENTTDAFSDGDAVATWTDGGSRGTDATQATEADKPTFRESVTAFNNRGAIEFAGSHDLGTASSTASTGALTTVVVWSADTTSAQYAIDGQSASYRHAIGISGGVFRNYFGVTVDDSADAPTTGQAYLSVSVAEDGAQAHYRDGALDYTGTVNIADSTGVWIGSGHGGGSSFLDGHVAYVAVFDGDLRTEAGFWVWQQQIMDYYGIAADVENMVGWHSMFRANGPEFAAQAYSDTDSVTTWPNEITAESDLATADDAFPTFTASVAELNGQPAVDFDGVNDGIETGTFTADVVAPSILLIANIATDGGRIVDAHANVAGRIIMKTETTYGIWDDGWVNGGTVATGAHSLLGQVTATSGSVFVDGIREVFGALSGSNALSGFHVGGTHDGSYEFEGQVSVAGLFEGDLTTDNGYPALKAACESLFGVPLPLWSPLGMSGLHSAFLLDGPAMLAEGYADTNTVTTWPNETGEADATNESTGPTYVASHSAMNNQPAVEFAGSNTSLITGTFTSDPTAPTSVLIVAKADVTGASEVLFCDSSSQANRVSKGGADTWQIANTANRNGSATVTTDAVALAALFTDDASADTLHVNGVSDINTDAGSNSILGQARIGANSSTTSYPWDGPMTALLILEGDFATHPMAGAFKDMALAKWGVMF